MSTFRDSNKSFNLDGGLLKTMANWSFNNVHSNPQDQKLINEFGKEMKINIKQLGRKIPRDDSHIKILNSRAIMASGISTIFLSSGSEELCDKLKLLLQEKQAGNNFKIFNEEVVAIVDKLLEHKCISKTQHRQTLIRCYLIHTKKK